jgi:ribosomal protein S18 acetylase RimI-like enzyme
MQIRPMTHDDAGAVAALELELGYQGTVAQVERRFASLDRATDAVFVSIGDQAVTGWIHVHTVQTLTSDRRAEILGLVVSKQTRRAGVGRALVTHVEAWARAQNLATVRVRCSVTRAEAHDFYRALGYATSKRQEIFDKALRCGPAAAGPYVRRRQVGERGT